MFGLDKVFGVVLIALMLLTGISASAAAGDKFLTVHARTQNNDGDGVILFFDIKDNYISQQSICKGETVIINLTQFPNVNRLTFNSKNRHQMYNANIDDIQNYIHNSAWENETDYYLDVNFYKKTAYDNTVFYPNGWVYARDLHNWPDVDFSFSAIQNGVFGKCPAIGYYWKRL
ncbi:MAG: hypothetical protein LBD03_07020 [Methanobrevibacter sp.]|jgi:hypothetical protein|nr:hypothetical protein [Candidatus Methanovirga procula]